MALLGKIEKIEDLRTIWPHEARDFSISAFSSLLRCFNCATGIVS